MKFIIGLVFVAAFAVGLVYNVYALSTAGYSNTVQCSENGGWITGPDTCKTIWGEVTYD